MAERNEPSSIRATVCNSAYIYVTMRIEIENVMNNEQMITEMCYNRKVMIMVPSDQQK